MYFRLHICDWCRVREDFAACHVATSSSPRIHSCAGCCFWTHKRHCCKAKTPFCCGSAPRGCAACGLQLLHELHPTLYTDHRIGRSGEQADVPSEMRLFGANVRRDMPWKTLNRLTASDPLVSRRMVPSGARATTDMRARSDVNSSSTRISCVTCRSRRQNDASALRQCSRQQLRMCIATIKRHMRGDS
jgi:hypothetical protein